MTDKNSILNKVKEVIHSFDPEAEVILYGSRARSDAAYDSDWDFLILTSIDYDHEMKFRICHALYEIEWDTGEVITPIIHEKKYWNRPLNRVSPFYRNVVNEGIAI